ncbi:hypothetical protein KM043_005531 [Ampulex compressa]|nr:hypothetical protein KM043_005531 [Ampulex compressa]
MRNIRNLNANELKAYMREAELSPVGTKAELIDRLSNVHPSRVIMDEASNVGKTGYAQSIRRLVSIRRHVDRSNRALDRSVEVEIGLARCSQSGLWWFQALSRLESDFHALKRGSWETPPISVEIYIEPQKRVWPLMSPVLRGRRGSRGKVFKEESSSGWHRGGERRGKTSGAGKEILDVLRIIRARIVVNTGANLVINYKSVNYKD